MENNEGVIIVVFDLPTTSEQYSKIYRAFVGFLKKDGYSMIQKSMYVKMVGNLHLKSDDLKRLKENCPKEGIVSAICLTKKQYDGIVDIVGEIPKLEFDKIKIV